MGGYRQGAGTPGGARRRYHPALPAGAWRARGKSVLDKVLGLWFLLLASVQALWLLHRLSPRCVVGWRVCRGPGGVAAWLLRKPLLIHEQNAVAGTTNRLLAPLAAQVIAAFQGLRGASRTQGAG